jgi:hypothetical protein
MKNSEREEQLRGFYRAFSGEAARPLEPDSPLYVPILAEDRAKDPILDLKTRIEWEESQSVSLLTGFRGNGKSTELRRLRKLLTEDGCKVFLVDMLDYVIMSKPLELSDFILSLMIALSNAVQAETGLDSTRKGYIERLANFLNAELESDVFKLKGGGAGFGAELGLKLKTDPTFKDHIQVKLRGHLTRLVDDAQNFVSEVVTTLRKKEKEPFLKVVFLVDSIEQLRGAGSDAEKVQNSVVETFSGQAANLMFPMLHIVYTVPPYLNAIAQNTGRSMGGNPVTCWPNVHVRHPNGNDDDHGLSIMEALVAKRFADWEKLFFRPQLIELAKASGGDRRDYFRLLRECVVSLRNTSEPKVTASIIKRVKSQLISELTPIAADDAHWLLRVHKNKNTSLASIDDLPRLARFLDSNLIMNYMNGESWYDIHPLIREEIAERAGERPGGKDA